MTSPHAATEPTTHTTIVAVIPAHLASVRFPRKVLHPVLGLPMMEHVRRRALMAGCFAGVVVATCDNEIASVLQPYGADVVMTSDSHRNGTARVCEAIQSIDCTHVVLLQADEPLLLPSHLESIVAAMRRDPQGDAWNITGPLRSAEELDRHSFVKCVVGSQDRMLFCCRRSPSHLPFEAQSGYVRKVLGIIGYRRQVLTQVVDATSPEVERSESVEQLRILDQGFRLRSVPVDVSLPSVNEPYELDEVLRLAQSDRCQQRLLREVAAFKG